MTTQERVPPLQVGAGGIGAPRGIAGQGGRGTPTNPIPSGEMGRRRKGLFSEQHQGLAKQQAPPRPPRPRVGQIRPRWARYRLARQTPTFELPQNPHRADGKAPEGGGWAQPGGACHDLHLGREARRKQRLHYHDGLPRTVGRAHSPRIMLRSETDSKGPLLIVHSCSITRHRATIRAQGLQALRQE